MKTKLWTGLSLALIVALLVTGLALAYVGTDQADYAPGSVVTIFGDNSDGAGFLAGEAVHVDVWGPNGYTAACDATADENGAWSCQVTLWDSLDAVGDYAYTATGLASGVSQSGTFTDGNVRVSGTVTDGTNPISGATVECTVGCNEEEVTATNTFGNYFFGTGNQLNFPGNSATLTLTASALGCTPESQDLDVVNGLQVVGLNFTLSCGVANQPPTVDAGGPYSGAEGSSISINGASASDPDSDTLTYIWTKSESGFDLGATCALTNANTLSPSLNCTDDGTVTLTLVVDDGHGHTPSDTATVTVTNADPIIDSVSNSGPIFEGSSATINVTAHDPGSNDTLSYAYDCDNDSVYENTTSSCSFADNVGSPFTVGVQVADDDGGSATGSTQVTVDNANPVVAVPSWTSTSVACRQPATLTNISFSDAGVNDDPWNVSIDWGDASYDAFPTDVQGDQADQAHAYNTPGFYTATVTVTDKDAGYGSNTSSQLEVKQTYTVDFLPPFDDSTPSGLIVNKMKNGRVVPVKITIFDVCTQSYVTDPTASVTIKLTKTSGTGTGDPIEEYADAGQSSAGTNAFRWTADASAPGGGFWIYNLDSKALGLVINSLYRVDAYVGSVKATESNWGILQPVK